jgi:hypothetical protein
LLWLLDFIFVYILLLPPPPPMLLLLLPPPAARGRDANPLAHVLQAIGEPLECVQYNTWNVLVPEGQFLTRVGWAQQAIASSWLASLSCQLASFRL